MLVSLPISCCIIFACLMAKTQCSFSPSFLNNHFHKTLDKLIFAPILPFMFSNQCQLFLAFMWLNPRLLWINAFKLNLTAIGAAKRSGKLTRERVVVVEDEVDAQEMPTVESEVLLEDNKQLNSTSSAAKEETAKEVSNGNVEVRLSFNLKHF